MCADPTITFLPVTAAELPQFAAQLQEAFSLAIMAAFHTPRQGSCPDDAYLAAAFQAPGAEVYHLLADGQQVGGTVLNIDRSGGRNSLELLFLQPHQHNRGLGQAIWQAIEARYPETRVWETITSYFEQRNIHFYVNKCGFHIVEFYGPHHQDPAITIPCAPDGRPMPGTETFFRFEKIMG